MNYDVVSMHYEPRTELLQVLREQRPLVVVGTGFTVATTSPGTPASWPALIRHGASYAQAHGLLDDHDILNVEQLLTGTDADDMIAAADIVHDALATRAGAFDRWLAVSVGRFTVDDPRLRDALCALNAPLATTNYDTLLSTERGEPPVPWTRPAEALAVLRGQQRGVIHIHGVHSDPESVVFGTRSYGRVRADEHAQFLQHLIGADRTLIFVGCGAGLLDPNIRGMFDWLDNLKVRHEHFRLCRSSEAGLPPATCLVDVIYGDEHEQLSDYLQVLAIDAALPADAVTTSRANPNLVQLGQMSDIAVQDADRVGSDHSGGPDETVLLSEDLYVPRPLEKDLLEAIDEGTPAIVVVGEAGHGKTSLLWRVHQQLTGNGAHAFLIRAPLLRLPGEDGPGLAAERLLAAVEVAAATSIDRVVVLLDTADARLRTEWEREALLELLVDLQGRGAQLAISSRPREAAALAPLKARRLELGLYGDELPDAVARYVRRYYRATGELNPQAAAQRILDAVTHGMPIRHLCQHPLHLRMLFETYAPFQIVEEAVDTAALYERYWERRVRRDLRPGAPNLASDPTEDLHEVTLRVARVLLALGAPEASAGAVGARLPALGGPADDIDRLRARGILTEDADVVGFFHQTFFEYAAALDLLQRGENLALAERAALRPDDAFLAAVHEQALLLLSSAKASSRQAGIEVSNLLRDQHPARQASGLYAYIAWRSSNPALEAVADELLARGDRELVGVFVRHAPAVPVTRIPDVLARLVTSWHSEPKARGAIIATLRRLAPRAPVEVAAAIDMMDATRTLIASPNDAGREAGAYVELLLMPSLHADGEQRDRLAAWAWEHVVRWCALGARQDQIRRIAPAVAFAALASWPHLPAPVTAAYRLCEAAKLDTVSRPEDPVPQRLAELFARGWHEQHRTVAEILPELTGEETLPALGRLHSLPVFLANTHETVDVGALLMERPISERFLWVSRVLPGVLGARESQTGQLLWGRMREVAGDPPSGGDRREDIGIALRESLVLAPVTPHQLVACLDGAPGLDAHEPWLDPDWMGEILAAATVGGHRGAQSAFDALLTGQAVASPKLNAALSRTLRTMRADPAQKDLALSLALDLAIATNDLDDAELAVAALQHDQEAVSTRAAALLALWRRTRDSRSPQKRRAAYRLLDHMTACGIDIDVTLPWLWQRASEGKTEHQLPIIRTIERMAVTTAFPAEAALEHLRRTQNMEPHVADRALTARCNIAAAHPDSYPLSSVVDILLESELTGKRAAILAAPLNQLADMAPGEALALLKRLFCKGAAKPAGRKAGRDAGSTLRPAIRTLAGRLTVPQATELLQLATEAPEPIAIQIGAALGTLRGTDLHTDLEQALASERLTEGTKTAVRSALRAQGRRAGNEGWEDLLHVQRST